MNYARYQVMVPLFPMENGKIPIKSPEIIASADFIQTRGIISKLKAGYLVNCLEHFFLYFFCLQIKFPQPFAMFQISL
jgi:hypothetical protein